MDESISEGIQVRLLAICVLVVPALLGQSTFYRDVLPILQNRCQSCHRPGEIAPFPLMTYEQARPWAKAIRVAVLSRKMPPWFADGGHFLNDRTMSPSEINTISAWATSGSPAGNPNEAPPPVKFTEGWRIDKPDAVFDTGVDFPIPERGEVPYQFFVVHTGFKEDRWIREIDIRPGNRAAVHHIGLYVRPPGSLFMSHAIAGKAFVPYRDETAQIETQGSTGTVIGLTAASAQQIFAYLPGAPPLRLNNGNAYLIRAGSDLLFEVHYTATGKRETDRSSVGFVFSEPPMRRIVTAILVNFRLRIPAGESHHLVDAAVRLTENCELLSIQPHMHLRGTGFQLHAIYPSGKDDTLLKLRRYDFNWQLAYELEHPIFLPKGTTLKMTGEFDNSANNPANPNPNENVFWGDQTSSEMLSSYLRLAIPVYQDTTMLVPAQALTPEDNPFGKDSWEQSARRLVQDWKIRLGIP